MIDVVAWAVRDVAAHSAWMPAACFVAGVVASTGPCVAPRFVAVTAMNAGADRTMRLRRTTAFLAGLVAWYVALGLAGAWIVRLASGSWLVNLLAAAAMLALGALTLARGCSTHRGARGAPLSLGASFLFGASFGLIAAPCCTPLVLALASAVGSSGDPWYVALAVAAFASGHVLPLAFAGEAASRFGSLLERHALEAASSVVGGALMLALGGYFVLLT